MRSGAATVQASRITALTLRRTGPGGVSILLTLHWRDPGKVTYAGGMCQMMPVGVFQPADDEEASVRHDLNLWHRGARVQ